MQVAKSVPRVHPLWKAEKKIFEIGKLIFEIEKQVLCKHLCAGKAKMEQQKTSLLMDLNSSRHTLEELNMEKTNIEKNNKMMQV